MNKPSRNSLKGYTYQQYIVTLFLAKMDIEHKISKMESEAIGTKQFDDVYIELVDGKKYRIQAKNYPNTTIDDIAVTDHFVTVSGNQNAYEKNDNNVLFVNTGKISTNTEFMGFPATIKNGIVIVPMTENIISDTLDDMYQKEERELQIIQKAYEFTCAEKFLIALTDLPPIITLSNTLLHNTVLVRPVLERIEKGITYIVGKPGVGKSHYVDELTTVYSDAIIYRFWVGSQDEYLSHRLRFDTFQNEIGLLAFGSPRSFTKEEVVSKLVEDEKILIIDGLDHVENYNYADLQNFVDFIAELGKNEVRVVVLSRPMKTEISWEKTELINWNFDETRMYLASAYGITEYDVHKKLYKIANGYPIVTYFLAEHFLKYGMIDCEEPISDLTGYYDNLLESISTKSLLCIFATNNSFFTYSELRSFVTDPEMYDALVEFIAKYSYLFEIVQNRIALIHDSLNTYLRDILSSFPQRREIVIKTVQDNLRSKNVEYMSRLTSFNFSETFLDELLIAYCDFDNLQQLLNNSVDYNSIASFYSQLQYILEKREGLLDVYQYYSFALIYQALMRNDLFGYEGLLFQLVLYLEKHGGVEEQIFSSGIMWNVYLALNHREDLVMRFVADSMYGSEYIHSLAEKMDEERNFFICLENPFVCEDIKAVLNSTEINTLDKSDILQDYLVSLWLRQGVGENFYDELCSYLNDGDNGLIYALLKYFNYDTHWVNRAALGAKNKLYELGFFSDKNNYRFGTIKQIITDRANEGSFYVLPAVQAFLRLANHENRDVDICSLNAAWIMYAQRKDYSVYTIDQALIIFEEIGLLEEDDSIEIINRLMEQSEKGIRHLLYSYINSKGSECTKRLISAGYFSDDNFKVDIFDLSPQNIDCFPQEYITERVITLLRYSARTKTIEASYISNVLESKYAEDILDTLAFYDMCILGSVDEPIERILHKWKIRIMDNSPRREKQYIPFDHGNIHEEDFEYIREKDISADECARYADGWYSCLPFVELYELFQKEELKEKFLHLLHLSMFARVVDKQYIGNWNHLIGNIPRFIKLCDVEVKWSTIFQIFLRFLDLSQIYYPPSIGTTEISNLKE